MGMGHNGHCITLKRLFCKAHHKTSWKAIALDQDTLGFKEAYDFGPTRCEACFYGTRHKVFIINWQSSIKVAELVKCPSPEKNH